jgi:NADH-quinone oxidoreductase subunit F
MNFEQIRAAAEAECDYLSNQDSIKIYVSSSPEDATFADIRDCFQKGTEQHNISASVITAGSFGYDDLEPIVRIEKPGRCTILYHNMTPETASELADSYLQNDDPRPDLALCRTGDEEISDIPHISQLPLFNLQSRTALKNCGYIDPKDINQYIVAGKGYSGLSRALQLSRKEVIEELGKSGLRGRGGAGYATAAKWQICHDTEDTDIYAVCNAVDADPKARTARLLLESDPHSVLEGLLIGTYAVGAVQCFICVNSEYHKAIEILRQAIEQMRKYSLLGDNVLDSDFKCDIEIKEITSSLVSGEETALIRSLENKQAMPYLRTFYPAVKGLNDKPTLINNTETLACVSAVFRDGTESVAGTGTEKSKGTKIITLSGKIAHGYTIEVPFGTTLRSIVEDIGGGMPGGKSIKAVQFGGPTGALFSNSSLDTPVNYEAMEEAGGIIGSGTVEVLDSDICTVEMTRDIVSYIQAESCGKCVFCREGTYQIADILNDIAENKGTQEDLDLIIELAEGMKIGSICGLGRTAPLPVLSSINLFRDDYDAHIRDKRCPVKNREK